MLSRVLGIPAFLAVLAPEAGAPPLVEFRAGWFVLRGTPDDSTYAALRRLKFTHVLDLRQDGEGDAQREVETRVLTELQIAYVRYAIPVAPPAGDFDFLRELLRSLPKGARVLVHCGDGNRAAAAVCAFLVLDRGLKAEEALRLGREAGLRHPATEAALDRYLQAHAKA